MKNTSLLKRSILMNFFLKSSIILLILTLMFSCKKKEKQLVDQLSFHDLLSSKPIQFTLTTDIRPLLVKGQEEEFQPAFLKIENAGKNVFEGNIKVRKRGVTRKRICNMPPLKFKIGKKETKLELKLVSPCQEGEDYQQLVFKEHLIYKMYNELSDFSFRVQMVHLKYEDTEGREPSFENYGFLIEDNGDLAGRIEADIFKPSAKMKSLDNEQYRIFTLFQYMIGNTDWNLTKGHNLKMVSKKESKTPIPVPYDFDYAGLVNAPYAIPHPKLPIRNVRERHFMWRGKNKDGFENTIELFQKKQANILVLIQRNPYLSEPSKQEMELYINSFYKKFEEGKIVGVIE